MAESVCLPLFRDGYPGKKQNGDGEERLTDTSSKQAASVLEDDPKYTGGSFSRSQLVPGGLHLISHYSLSGLSRVRGSRAARDPPA